MSSGAALDEIDWHTPWLAPLQEVAEPLRAAGPHWRIALNTLAHARELCNGVGLPLQFVDQSALPAGVGYEAFIGATGCVPTRNNLHDFFNGLLWLAYPRTKARLNALQVADISAISDSRAAAASRHRRSGLRDALTLFDENVALVVTRDTDLITALQCHRWQTLFVERRARFFADAMVLTFGHALLEKLVRPYKSITAHAWLVPLDPAALPCAPDAQRAVIDAHVAAQLDAQLRSAAFCHLPVLGLPDWSTGQSAAFYADQAVFRPLREPRRDKPAGS
ncbi:MAG: DUF3025 domain-containing protein [Pseudomonadota bacterium]|nr:DUF3025 domain-containing protein [Pseudomonadota bacterium]